MMVRLLKLWLLGRPAAVGDKNRIEEGLQYAVGRVPQCVHFVFIGKQARSILFAMNCGIFGFLKHLPVLVLKV